MKFILLYILLQPIIFAEHLKNTNLQLSWFDQFQFAGYYIAKEKGYYKEEGLNVKIKPFDFDINITKEVSQGRIDFAIGRETLVLDYLNEYNNISAIYSLFQDSPLVLISKKSSNIESLKDFTGKKLMATSDDASQISINAMLKSQKIDLNNIKYLNHSHNINDLINGKTDLISAYLSKSPYFLKKMNISYQVYNPSDYMFDMYSDFLFTNKELIRENPKLVESFKMASLKGWDYAFSNIEETVDLILKKYNTQNLSKKELLYEAKELKKLAYYKNNNLGDINNTKLQRIADLYTVMGYVNDPKNQNIKDFYYNNQEYLLSRQERVFLKNKDVLKMCIQSNSYPYQEMQNNEFIGIVSKYTKLFEKLIDKRIIIVPTPNENIAKVHLLDDKCDLISFLTKKDTNDFIYTKNYLSLPIVLLTKNSKEFVYNFEQLNNKRLLISNSKIDVNYLKQKYPDIQFKINTNEENIIEQIYDENIYGFVTDIIHAIDILKKQTGVSIHIGGKFDESITLGFVLNENNKILADILDKLIENISKNQHDKLMSSFTYINYKEVPDYSLLWKILTLSSIFSLILIIFIFREEKLKQKIITLNKDLKIRIKDEVALNRKKDEFIFRQSKLASMGEMLTNIAHQWRQPLTRINLSIEVMSSVIENEETKNKSILEEKISLIKKDIVYMSNTIHDFSNFFHPNKEMTVFNLNDVIGKSISLVKNKDIDIEFIIEIDKDITLKNYENELIQVIMVLLDNSLDSFRLKKYGNKKINIYTKKFEKNIELSILDNAGGIDARIISRIFEPYFSTKFKDQGVGIGLYMAKMLIEDSMRGNIIVDSFDDFTHFTISLPRIINE